MTILFLVATIKITSQQDTVLLALRYWHCVVCVVLAAMSSQGDSDWEDDQHSSVPQSDDGNDDEDEYIYHDEDDVEHEQIDMEAGAGAGGAIFSADSSMCPAFLAEMDIAEVNVFAKRGFSARYWTAGSAMHICLGFKPSELNKEQCLALGIQHKMPIFIEFMCSPFYVQGTERPTVARVYQHPDTQFALAWMIKDRLQTQFRDWPPQSLVERANPTCDRHVADLVGAFGVSSAFAMDTLQRASFNYVDSTLLLLEQQASKATKRDLDEYWDYVSCRNPLVQIITFVNNVIQTAHLRCLICDDPIDHVGLKPVICNKDICMMAYEEMGVGLDVTAELIRDPDTIDLLLTVLYAAAHGGRIELCFPEPVFDGVVNKALLETVLNAYPSVEDMVQLAMQGKLKEALNAAHEKAYPLLRWIISSSRAHIRPLQQEEHIPSIESKKQFVLLTAPIEKERRFQELKRQNGSIFAFHGSGIGNWHSILRNGLKNYSNTKYMSTGAVHGAGIYFARNMATSMGYCQSRSSLMEWRNSGIGKSGCTIMALCEIINRPSDFTTNGSDIVVVPQDEYVITRYLIVNPTSSYRSVQAPRSLPDLLRAGADEEEETGAAGGGNEEEEEEHEGAVASCRSV